MWINRKYYLDVTCPVKEVKTQEDIERLTGEFEFTFEAPVISYRTVQVEASSLQEALKKADKSLKARGLTRQGALRLRNGFLRANSKRDLKHAKEHGGGYKSTYGNLSGRVRYVLKGFPDVPTYYNITGLSDGYGRVTHNEINFPDPSTFKSELIKIEGTIELELINP